MEKPDTVVEVTSQELLAGDTDGDINPLLSRTWIDDIEVEFEGKHQFEYNEQKVTLICICTEEVELFDHSQATCLKCGRVYTMETKIKVSWVGKEDS